MVTVMGSSKSVPLMVRSSRRRTVRRRGRSRRAIPLRELRGIAVRVGRGDADALSGSDSDGHRDVEGTLALPVGRGHTRPQVRPALHEVLGSPRRRRWRKSPVRRARRRPVQDALNARPSLGRRRQGRSRRHDDREVLQVVRSGVAVPGIVRRHAVGAAARHVVDPDTLVVEDRVAADRGARAGRHVNADARLEGPRDVRVCDDVAFARPRAADDVVRRAGVNAAVGVAEGNRARHVGADEIALDHGENRR